MSGTLLNACLVLWLVQVGLHCSCGEVIGPPATHSSFLDPSGCTPTSGCSFESNWYCLIYKECKTGVCVCKRGYHYQRKWHKCVLDEPQQQQPQKWGCEESCEKDEDCYGELSCRCSKCGCGKDRKCVTKQQSIHSTKDECVPLHPNYELKAGGYCSYPAVYCGVGLVCRYCPDSNHMPRCMTLPDA